MLKMVYEIDPSLTQNEETLFKLTN